MIPAGFLAPGWPDAPRSDVTGKPCEWPFDPLLLVANGPVPLGQYHCPACGSMVVAGVPHPHYFA